MRKEVLFMALAAIALVACKPGGNNSDEPREELPDWYYTGGTLGTTTNTSSMAFRQPTPATEAAGMGALFAQGDQIAEKEFVTNESGRQHGLGPVYVRSSCQHCHPNYSHGTSVPEGTYNASKIGNGTLLVVIDPETQNYVTWLAGMPQLFGAAPFKAPLDPNQITVTWKTAVDEHGNQFPDGETYELRYPEVKMPNTAVYVYNQGYRDEKGLLESEGYEVKLENTIGVYGSGLLDAISDEDLIAQYKKEGNDKLPNGEPKLKNGLNPAFWDGTGLPVATAYYGSSVNNPTTKWGPKRFTYALTRGPLQDGAGANAIWNITNVTRSDRRKHYLDLNGTIYATCASKDPEVQEKFGTEEEIYNYLTSTTLPAEMTDEEFTQVMIWHRGLAVPAARNVNDPKVLKGKELFTQIGCDYCHRPTWTTGEDEIRDPNGFFAAGDGKLPRHPKQKIWPYTDMIQHKLCMVNDIRTGWCRTTPLWGRGLHKKATGDAYEARMHDTRARNVIEAIMWHGYSTESDAYWPTQQFYNLQKEDRDAIVAFINAI